MKIKNNVYVYVFHATIDTSKEHTASIVLSNKGGNSSLWNASDIYETTHSA